MREDFKTKSVLIWDNGDYTSIAETLAKSFGKVYYCTPRTDPCYPQSNPEMMGSGLAGVTRILDPWAKNVYDDVDLFCFFDIYDGNLQLRLQDQGKRVWGSRRGDQLENDRDDAKKHLKKIGFHIGDYKVVKGVEDLRSWLKWHDNQWVKIPRLRGEGETFFSPTYKEVEQVIDRLAYKLGKKKDWMEFIVEASIPDAVEIAYDGYTIDGRFPSVAMVGVEIKNKGYASNVLPDSKWPKQIRDTNALISETLKNYQYRNFFSHELRVTKDGTPWAIDVCARVPMPPGELQQMMIGNWPEILWAGAAGELVEPEMKAKAGVELMMRSTWAEENWQAVNFPEKLRDHVKLRRHCIKDGQDYVIPGQAQIPELGGIVAIGNSIKEATNTLKEIADQVDGHDIDIFPEALDHAQEEIDKLAEFGIEI